IKMLEDLETYVKWVGTPGKAAIEYLNTWVKLMSPITPFIAEELWSLMGGHGYVAKAVIDKELTRGDHLFEVEQRYVDIVTDDIRSVLEVVGGDTVVVYTLDKELAWIAKKVAEEMLSGAEMSDIIRRLSRELTELGIRQPDRVIRTVHEVVSYLGPEKLIKYFETSKEFDEFSVLTKYRGLIVTRLGLKDLVVYRASDPRAPDLGGRKSRALPLKPGIYATSST
ncbi:MAG: class I tRNA ligase family protein, partial [Sulfolobales archaeon]